MLQPEILHPLYFDGPYGEEMKAGLRERMADFAGLHAADEAKISYSGVTVALHAHNDTPAAVARAFRGIDKQLLVSNVEKVLIDTGNDPSTIDAAKALGARIEPVEMGKSFRADVLRRGVDTASHEHVFQMPAHAVMATNVALAAGLRHFMISSQSNSGPVAGVYGVVVPDENATGIERRGSHWLGATKRLKTPAGPRAHGAMGFLDGACSMVRKGPLRTVGSYPAEYGAGGADGELGRRLIEADFTVIEDDALTVHHTHEFGSMRSALQVVSWALMRWPRSYKPLLARWHPHGGL